MKSSGNISSGSAHKSCGSEGTKAASCKPNLAVYKTLPFGSMEVAGLKESWRTVDTWHCERSGKATVEGAASVAVANQGHWRFQGKQQMLNEAGLSLGDTLCACVTVSYPWPKLGLPKPLEPKDCESQTPDPELQDLIPNVGFGGLHNAMVLSF